MVLQTVVRREANNKKKNSIVNSNGGFVMIAILDECFSNQNYSF